MFTFKELEFFKSTEVAAWLLYIGPVLFSFALNDQFFFERFMSLSYSDRQMIISADYAEDAKRLVSLFLKKDKRLVWGGDFLCQCTFFDSFALAALITLVNVSNDV